jgi:ABC-type dipeptide/oligopeptide/nickel transport system ATPase subunit
MIWEAVSWYCAGLIITLNGRMTASDYVDILGKQVHPMVQMLLPNIDVIFQDDSSPIHAARSVRSWFEEPEDAHMTSFLASTIARFEYHRTTVVSFRVW